ncbi:cobyric acid synthase [Shumkonia mesophila]|uniref:cobyric acid synthase n=1 Tax=Shumkonia mesophila TaxID=2838854 RepID=UPI002934BA5D|nr:cobyric acid synthase [Shumkonia mesophila]
MAAVLMLQGTGSDVGKSVLTAGLARAFTRRGLTVRPFKPQNMSNNAAVTDAGGEIGRAQWVQAVACRVAPSVDMNPVLLKPQSDLGAQVVVHGRVVGTAEAGAYQARKGELLGAVLESFARLAAEADLVLVEGAGSPAETNLRAGDIANMGFAAATGTPVVLVGDIDRGGVIAALVGTHAVLSTVDRALVKGFIINKFRGDIRLFDDGLVDIVRRTGWPSFGVVPWLVEARRLPAEDAVVLDDPVVLGTPYLIQSELSMVSPKLLVAVPMLSRIANFDDLDPLAAEPDVAVRFVPPGTPLPADAGLVVLPGSKATLADLRFLKAQGWDIDILAHVRRGGRVLGLCGGFQMLGRSIADPDGIEGPPETAAGLGLIDVETRLEPAKTLRRVAGSAWPGGPALTGYEIHNGVTAGDGLARPFLALDGQPHGATSADGRVAGCYVHGLFETGAFRGHFLAGLGLAGERPDQAARLEAALDGLAAHLEAHLDLDGLLAVAGSYKALPG